MDNPIYDGILPHGEQESEFIARNNGIYDTPEDLKHTYMSDLQCSMEGNVYENPFLGVHPPMVRASCTYFDNFVCVLTKTFPYVTPTGKWCSIGMLLSR